MDPNAEQLDAEARAAAAAAAQAEVARAAAQAEANESAATLAGILKAITDSSDKIDKIELKLDAVTTSLDGLNDRADKTDERLRKQKEFFSGPGLLGEHKEELKSLILGTVVENKSELSMVSADDMDKLSRVSDGFTADLDKVVQKLSTTDGRLSSLQSKYDQIQTSSPQTPVADDSVGKLATILEGVITRVKTPGDEPPGGTPPPTAAGSIDDYDPNAYSGSSFPRHLIFFEGKTTDNDIVFNPQVNPRLQLRLWQDAPRVP